MSPKQTGLYWRTWALAKAKFIAFGYEPKEAEAERKILTEKALGKPKSSTAFNNKDLDAVLAMFRAVYETDLDKQLAAADAARIRMRHGIKSRNMEAYAQSLAEHIYGRSDWENLPESELQKIAMRCDKKHRDNT
jgi:hypothetical protein